MVRTTEGKRRLFVLRSVQPAERLTTRLVQRVLAPLITEVKKLLAGHEGAAHLHAVPRFLCMEPHLRSSICFHGVFKGRVPFYYGLESLTFTPLKKGVEQGYDRSCPSSNCTRHCR